MSAADQPKSYYKSVIGIILLSVCVLVVLLGGPRGVGREQAEALLQRFGQHVAAEAQRVGKQASFTYGSVDTQGWGYDRKAVVSDVKLVVIRKVPMEAPQLVLSTSSMVIESDSALPKQASISFPDPVTIAGNDRMVRVITPEAPIRYNIQYDGKTPVVVHTIQLPQQIVIAPESSTQTGKRTVLSLAPGSNLRAEVNTATSEMKIDANAAGIKVVSDEGNYSIGSLSAYFTQQPAEENKRVAGKYEWRASDIRLHEDNASEKPYSFVLDADYTADPTELSLFDWSPSLAEHMDLSVQKVALLGDDFSIIGTGQLAVAPDDPLPFGALDMEITNPGKLLSSGLIPVSLRGPLKAAIKKASGTQTEVASSTAIPLKRAKNGVFYIGGATFEAITAAMLGNLLNPIDAPEEVPQNLPPLPEGAPGLNTLSVSPAAGENIQTTPPPPAPTLAPEATQ